MCGIFAYIGLRPNVKTAIDGLHKLEYRGYDSAGLAGFDEQKIVFSKEVGKVSVLEREAATLHLTQGTGTIAQTRWATHGKPTRENAHPHLDNQKTLALVHNGIIENHEPLRSEMKALGAKFLSDTDTEVIAHLISSLYEGDVLKAIQKAIPLLKGSYAIALIHQDHPNKIFAIAHQSPLVIGIGSQEAFISSDSNAFANHTRKVVFLADSEIAIISAEKVEIYDSQNEKIEREVEHLSQEIEESSKGTYEHYTLKEIHEQPQTIKNALLSRYVDDYGTAYFEEINLSMSSLLGTERILILACGTSWHAGYVAAYMIEDMARIPVQVEISSEFRYKNPIVQKGTLAIAISQSGETADTLAAMREIKAKGAHVIAICNVEGSTLAREAHSCIFLKAGQEVGVCSTKAFTSQVTVLSLVSLLLARMHHMSKIEGQAFIAALKKLPEDVQKVLDQEKNIVAIAKKYAKFNDVFFIGRHYMYPTSLEGALKLKEIAYVNANGYPAGEMKHGPIALINENCPTVALLANRLTFDKTLSNLMEVKARGGAVCAIVEEGETGANKVADDLIVVPKTIDPLAVIPTAVVTQIFAYAIAKERGAEIDQPRNLAKSVTVE